MKDLYAIEKEANELAACPAEDEGALQTAADLYEELLERLDDPFEKQIIRYNLGSLLMKRQDYEQASKVFQENYEKTKDMLSAIGWIECLLEPSWGGYDEKVALRLCDEFSGILKADILKVKILTEGSREMFDPEEAMKIIGKDIDLACENREFPLQPFPEFAAAYVWFSLNVFDPPITTGMYKLIKDAINTLEKKIKMEPDRPKDKRLMVILKNLLDESIYAG